MSRGWHRRPSGRESCSALHEPRHATWSLALARVPDVARAARRSTSRDPPEVEWILALLDVARAARRSTSRDEWSELESLRRARESRELLGAPRAETRPTSSSTRTSTPGRESCSALHEPRRPGNSLSPRSRVVSRELLGAPRAETPLRASARRRTPGSRESCSALHEPRRRDECSGAERTDRVARAARRSTSRDNDQMLETIRYQTHVARAARRSTSRDARFRARVGPRVLASRELLGAPRAETASSRAACRWCCTSRRESCSALHEPRLRGPTGTCVLSAGRESCSALHEPRPVRPVDVRAHHAVSRELLGAPRAETTIQGGVMASGKRRRESCSALYEPRQPKSRGRSSTQVAVARAARRSTSRDERLRELTPRSAV